ncbi:MAG: hypothetical protein Terrestrivirus10_41 [Terrestrivirus sp.]|uniref:Uncharacterized protein n=1 Tax=Terrestrivirus sp. TaxID=2487775 RepID=A0A3G4ZP45_9VIRU|nr:MAG: hypothetical protein Terrestrivirus10_41 [Terrestrivirus sp.]
MKFIISIDIGDYIRLISINNKHTYHKNLE